MNREHQRLGLVATDEAPRSTLVRRLYLDLIGLPPSATELAVLDADRSDDWYDRLVTRLLADPRHGERWARHWMDVWRYSDWWGLGDQLRNSQYHIWHWRDWIVESLNADTPYDEMVRLMLAADELRPDDLQQLRATGYLARNYFLFNRNQWMDETVEHVSKGFLGLTMNCAKCHDHKYDPFEQVDFYRLRAIFEPYHVRLDVVPGEADLMRDGIPRVFDGLPELPTYRFVRGQEGQPDKSKVIEPAVPTLLAFKPLEIKAVDLPSAAWQPERRSWVLDAHLLAAKKAVEKAAASVAPAKDKLAAAKKLESELVAAAAAAPKDPQKAPTPPGEKPSAEKSVGDAPAANNSMKLVDRFETLDAKRWKQFGGEWTHAPGKLQQKRDGAERAGLRMIADSPRDFDATFRFTILGGSRWRSVSLCFDSTQADPAAAPAAGDSEQSVYISAVSGGSKIQASYHQGGAWKYPTEAMRAMPIELNREYTLRVQVRDSLINAWLNGEFLLAWRTPLARRPGALQLTTFDALTSFAEFTLEPLPASVMLREPSAVATASGAPNAKPTTVEAARAAVKDSELELQAAELALATAQAEVASLTARGAALRESWSTTGAAPNQGGDAKDGKASELTVVAVKAERGVVAAKARQALVAAELKLHRAAAGK
ncbi:MAG TPA: DUF1549 domain-containing protein, partial [Pirellulaceae bacterium]|nr:DUF1549 domain-containing protein [Pirellulaceae bacterium]